MRKLLLTILMIGLANVVQGQEPNDWENPQVIGINKEPYHANLTLPSQKYNCGECESLDGSWKFRWYARPEQRIVEFYEPGFDVSAWDNIIVPVNGRCRGTAYLSTVTGLCRSRKISHL